MPAMPIVKRLFDNPMMTTIHVSLVFAAIAMLSGAIGDLDHARLAGAAAILTAILHFWRKPSRHPVRFGPLRFAPPAFKWRERHILAKRNQRAARIERLRRLERTAKAIGFFREFLTKGRKPAADSKIAAKYLIQYSDFSEISREIENALDILFATAADSRTDGDQDDIRNFVEHLDLANDDIDRALVTALRYATINTIERNNDRITITFETNTRRSLFINRRLLVILKAIGPRISSFHADIIEHAEASRVGAGGETSPTLSNITLTPIQRRIVEELNLSMPLTASTIQKARRTYARNHHPDQAPEHQRACLGAKLAEVNATLDELLALAS